MMLLSPTGSVSPLSPGIQPPKPEEAGETSLHQEQELKEIKAPNLPNH